MSGYCKYCDTLTNGIIKRFENGILVWVGCASCYLKQDEEKNNDRFKK